MPPKAKKAKTSKGKAKKNIEVERPTVKESLLQAELDKRIKELAELKLRAQTAQAENDLLHEEAKKVQTATTEYTSFMSKKTQYRQAQVVTLSDYYERQIEDVYREKEIMEKEYKGKKDEIREELIRKQKLLHELNDELETMNEYKTIHDKQNEEIIHLQKEISQIRSEHVQHIADMKIRHEKEIQQQREEESIKVEQIRRQASREAEQYLYDQTLDIQNINVELKRKLQEVLKRSNTLTGVKQRLEEEQVELINRIRLVADLRKIRLDKVSLQAPVDSSALVPSEGE